MSDESSDKPSFNLARLSLSVPLVVAAVALLGDIFARFNGFSGGRFLCLWLLTCSAGCAFAIIALISNRSCSSDKMIILALLLNIVVGLGGLFSYAMAQLNNVND